MAVQNTLCDTQKRDQQHMLDRWNSFCAESTACVPHHLRNLSIGMPLKHCTFTKLHTTQILLKGSVTAVRVREVVSLKSTTAVTVTNAQTQLQKSGCCRIRPAGKAVASSISAYQQQLDECAVLP
eukprot:6576-Heterococcus_DN1.PRE.2